LGGQEEGGRKQSASRYREIEQEQEFFDKPAVTLDRLRKLDRAAEHAITAEARRTFRN
jgi:hypothetical protein